MNKTNIAIALLIFGSIFPICVGSFLYLYYAFLPGMHLIEHVAFTNLIASGFTGLVLIISFIKTKNNLLLLFFLFLSMWVGGNDTYILLRNYALFKNVFPIALIPFTSHIIGLAILSFNLEEI